MQSSIKILYVIGTLEIGGTEGQLVELVCRLDRSRFSAVVVCLSSAGALAERLTGAGVRVDVVGLHGSGGPRLVDLLRRTPATLSAFRRLVRQIRMENPVIVHGLLFSAYVLGAFAARVAGVPIVVASRRSLGLFKASQPLYLLPERIASRMTDLVIANSEAVRRDVLREKGLPADKVIVIHNGLEVDTFPLSPNHRMRESLGLLPRQPVVAVVANFIHYKGHRFFVEAWARVVQVLPEAVALLIGEGPLRAEVQAQVEALGLGRSISFLGLRHDVPALLTLPDLVVHPSLQEGFSNAILEAMAAGKPVVATEVGGTPEAVVHGETGLLVPPRDSQALAEGILWLLQHPTEAARFGAAGRRRVTERFDLATMVRQYEAVYERLLAEKVPARAGNGVKRGATRAD